MRVPIENGSGFINQVSDFIKLSAAYKGRRLRILFKKLFYFEIAGCCFFITAKNTIYISAFLQAFYS